MMWHIFHAEPIQVWLQTTYSQFQFALTILLFHSGTIAWLNTCGAHLSTLGNDCCVCAAPLERCHHRWTRSHFIWIDDQSHLAKNLPLGSSGLLIRYVLRQPICSTTTTSHLYISSPRRSWCLWIDWLYYYKTSCDWINHPPAFTSRSSRGQTAAAASETKVMEINL